MTSYERNLESIISPFHYIYPHYFNKDNILTSLIAGGPLFVYNYVDCIR